MDKESIPVDEFCGCTVSPEDNSMIVCRCEEITRAEIIAAVRLGAKTIDEVKRRTRAGMGLCQSKTCSRLVQRIISDLTGKSMSEISPSTSRPPVRPIPIHVLGAVDRNESIH